MSQRQNGGGLRERWQDKRFTYEWDSLHGRVEKYSTKTGKHIGEFDTATGARTKPANPKYKLKK